VDGIGIGRCFVLPQRLRVICLATSAQDLELQSVMNRPNLLSFPLFFAMVGMPSPTQTEHLRISYELSLNRCKEHSCHAVTAARSEVEVSLEEEDANFLSGYSPVEIHAGSLAYQLRFNLSRVPEKNLVKRNLTIGFSGRTGTLTGKQLTWGEKSYKHKTWSEFKNASASGTAYSENDESVTPTLTVLDVSPADSR
jgi:hypothetical protein